MRGTTSTRLLFITNELSRATFNLKSENSYSFLYLIAQESGLDYADLLKLYNEEIERLEEKLVGAHVSSLSI